MLKIVRLLKKTLVWFLFNKLFTSVINYGILVISIPHLTMSLEMLCKENSQNLFLFACKIHKVCACEYEKTKQ